MKAVLRGSRRVLPAPGTVITFHTAPFTRFSPEETGRWAAFRVIGATPAMIAVLVLDGIWTAPPTLADAAACGILCEHRFSLRQEPAIFGLRPPDWKLADLCEHVLLGTAPQSTQERAHADHRIGGMIGTAERDDIRAALAEMALLAGQKRLLEEIDGWRDW